MRERWMRKVRAGTWRALARSGCMVLVLLGGTQDAEAGIRAERTRLIFDGGARERDLRLVNTNDYPILVQTWIDNGEGSNQPDTVVSPMLVLPAVLRMAPHEVKSVRVLYTDEPLPQDRESVFWLNLYEIALLPESRADKNEARVRLAINTQMKIFYRPPGLGEPPAQPGQSLSFSLRRQEGAWVLVCRNEGDRFASFASLALQRDGRVTPVSNQPDMMTPPRSERIYPLVLPLPETGAGGSVEYRLIDDLGNAQRGESPISPSRPVDAVGAAPRRGSDQ